MRIGIYPYHYALVAYYIAWILYCLELLTKYYVTIDTYPYIVDPMRGIEFVKACVGCIEKRGMFILLDI